MASRVSPKESCVVDIYDNGSSFSVKHIPDGESAIEPFQNENNTREQLLQAIGEVYRPVLSLMKLSGIYFGCTTLATGIQLSGQRRGTLISFCFCCVVVSGMWFNFVMPVVSAVVEGHVFRRIMIIFWCLLVALLGTTCLFVLSSTASRTSRFEELILKIISIKMVNPCLKKAKSRSRIFDNFFSSCYCCCCGCLLYRSYIGNEYRQCIALEKLGCIQVYFPSLSHLWLWCLAFPVSLFLQHMLHT